MGLTYGPLGTVLSELFPTSVRYTGSSLAFNFAGIFGASLAPYIATWLAKTYGLQYVGLLSVGIGGADVLSACFRSGKQRTRTLRVQRFEVREGGCSCRNSDSSGLGMGKHAVGKQDQAWSSFSSSSPVILQVAKD